VQFVLLLCLLVAEVIIQQHQLLQKSSFGSSNGALPVTAQASGGAYQRLPGSAAEFDDKQKQQQRQEQPQPPEKFSAWWVRSPAARRQHVAVLGSRCPAVRLAQSMLSAHKLLLHVFCA
jgi:hypothetical protein